VAPPALWSTRPGAARAPAGPCAAVSWARARADGYRAMQFNAVVETNAPAIRLWRSFGFQILATVPEAAGIVSVI
jgi:hypothetical protein